MNLPKDAAKLSCGGKISGQNARVFSREHKMVSNEQKKIILSLVSGIKNDHVQTLGGYAGTGKTTAIKWVKQKLKNFAVCAYTGKATNVLRNKGLHASTIHSLIYRATKDEKGDTTWWVKDKYDPDITPLDGFIVDEASMVSQEVYTDLLSFGKPLIFVGDHGQLEPIGGSKFNLMKNPMYRLEQVHRNAGEIALFAEHIRKGRSAHTFKAEKQVQLVQESAIHNTHLASVDQIIVAFNSRRVEINERVRKFKRLEYSYLAVGEKVICLRNNRQQLLFNGQQGIVTRISEDGERFDFTSDGFDYYDITYDPDIFGQEKPVIEYSSITNPFDYAYAITCHKAQGDEFGSVIVYEQSCRGWDHWRWAYTAASRASRSLIWVLDPKAATPTFIPNYI